MNHLFSPLVLRTVRLRNRIGLSPMCMYSCSGRDGVPTAWHMQHLGARAAGGCALVMTEATAVEPRGRISLDDTGLWNDDQVAAWRPITALVASLGAAPGIQLAHAGRKAGTHPPWQGRGPYTDADLNDGERDATALHPVAPSAIPFQSGMRVPHELATNDIAELCDAWSAAARRAVAAGFKVLELHMAHGYLLHEFLSPLSNRRSDPYGGDIEGRMRLPLEVARAVREAWPEELPLLVRISATDWHEGGWDVDSSVQLADALHEAGVDLVDVSSGGLLPDGRFGPVAGGHEEGYQVPFAERIRSEAGVATATVGLVSRPAHADSIIREGQADMVFLGRELLRHPNWPQQAARELGVEGCWPEQYGWALR